MLPVESAIAELPEVAPAPRRTETKPIAPPARACSRLVIEPRSGWRLPDLAALWRSRELLGFLVWRDIKVRYKQTVLGAAWAVIQPLMMMSIFAVFFGRFGGMARQVDVAYPLFVFAALLPWQLFATAVNQAGNSLVAGSHLISKVYFPRLIIPISSVGAAGIDFCVSLGVMFALMAWYGAPWTWRLPLVPLFAIGTLLAALGVGTFLSALVIAYRDFRHVMTFLVQVWMFASPVAYPLEIVPVRLRPWYALNPMVGMISGFRSSLLGTPWDWPTIAVSCGSIVGFLTVGLLYFRRTERRFADIV